MRESVPPKAKAPAVGTEARPAVRDVSAPATQYRFTVRYYRRMRLHRVYPTVVEARPVRGGSGAGNGPGSPVLIRPLIPGALVVPGELALDANQPGARATFYVTPLAKGKLPGACVEVRRADTLVQEIRLGMRGVTQRLTWFLAVLTVLVPAFLLTVTRYHPLKGTVPRPTTRPLQLGAPAEDKEPPLAPKVEPPGGPNPGPGQPPTSQLPARGDVLAALIALVDDDPPKKEEPPPAQKDPKKDDQPPPKKPAEPPDDKADGKDEKANGKDEKPPDAPKKGPNPGRGGPGGGGLGPLPPIGKINPPASQQVAVDRPAFPGEILEHEILTNVPEVPEDIRAKLHLPPITARVAAGLREAYDDACILAKEENLSFWVGVVFLVLTLLSWFVHRSLRGRRTGAPVTL
jgi:hypothetical protein